MVFSLHPKISAQKAVREFDLVHLNLFKMSYQSFAQNFHSNVDGESKRYFQWMEIHTFFPKIYPKFPHLLCGENEVKKQGRQT